MNDLYFIDYECKNEKFQAAKKFGIATNAGMRATKNSYKRIRIPERIRLGAVKTESRVKFIEQ